MKNSNIKFLISLFVVFSLSMAIGIAENEELESIIGIHEEITVLLDKCEVDSCREISDNIDRQSKLVLQAQEDPKRAELLLGEVSSLLEEDMKVLERCEDDVCRDIIAKQEELLVVLGKEVDVESAIGKADSDSVDGDEYGFVTDIDSVAEIGKTTDSGAGDGKETKVRGLVRLTSGKTEVFVPSTVYNFMLPKEGNKTVSVIRQSGRLLVSQETVPLDGESIIDGVRKSSSESDGNGKIFAWGSNNYAVSPSDGTDRKVITQVSVGRAKAAESDEKGKVYAWELKDIDDTGADGSDFSTEAIYQARDNDDNSSGSGMEILAWSWGNNEPGGSVEDDSESNIYAGFVSSWNDDDTEIAYVSVPNSKVTFADGGECCFEYNGKVDLTFNPPNVATPHTVLSTLELGETAYRRDGSVCGDTKEFMRTGKCENTNDNNNYTNKAQYGNEHGTVLNSHSCTIHGYNLDIVRPSGYAQGTTWRIIDVHKNPKAFYADWTEVQTLINNHLPENLYYQQIQSSHEAKGDYCDRDGFKMYNTNVYQVYLDHYNDYNGYTPKLDDSNLETAPLNLVVQSYNQNRNQGDALPATCNTGCISGGGVDPNEPNAPNTGGMVFGDDPRDINGWVDDLFPSAGGSSDGGRPIIDADAANDVGERPDLSGDNTGNPNVGNEKAAEAALFTRLNDGMSPGDLSENDKNLARQYLTTRGELRGKDFGLAVALEMSNNSRVRSVRFDNSTGQAHIEHGEQVRLLGFIPVNTRAQTTLSQNGDSHTSYPWWSFLAAKNEVKFKVGAELSRSAN